MAAKDSRNRNIRRGARVKDMSYREQGYGKIVGTAGVRALVRWDDSNEETLEKGPDLLVVERKTGPSR